MKELSIFDLRFGLYVKNYPYGQSPKSKIDQPGQNMRNFILYQISGSRTMGFWLFPELLAGLGSSGRLVGTISHIMVPLRHHGNEYG